MTRENNPANDGGAALTRLNPQPNATRQQSICRSSEGLLMNFANEYSRPKGDVQSDCVECLLFGLCGPSPESISMAGVYHLVVGGVSDLVNGSFPTRRTRATAPNRMLSPARHDRKGRPIPTCSLSPIVKCHTRTGCPPNRKSATTPVQLPPWGTIQK
jgi:hypothetical protein